MVKTDLRTKNHTIPPFFTPSLPNPASRAYHPRFIFNPLPRKDKTMQNIAQTQIQLGSLNATRVI
nr:hypothetical protein [uncultured Kingella sp.]